MDNTLYDGRKEPMQGNAELIGHLASRLDAAEIPFVYITGRRLEGIEQAISQYGLPVPMFAAASMGTAVYMRSKGMWHEVAGYREMLRSNWDPDTAGTLDDMMASSSLSTWRFFAGLEFWRSYRTSSEYDVHFLRSFLSALLMEHGLTTVQAVVSGPGYSDEMHIDFVPHNGSKVHAARFIAHELLGLDGLEKVLFTGDSGNDIDLLSTAGFAGLVKTNEVGLAELIQKVRPDIFISPYPNLTGVVHAMLNFGMIAIEG